MLHSVSLRPTGGFYFTARERVAELEAVVRAVEKSSSAHTIYNIPAMETAKAVQAILDGLVREAEQEASECLDSLAAQGERALGNRRDRIEAMEEKLASYDRMLGGRLQAIKDAMHETRATIVAARVAKQDSKDS